jgi:DNA-binding PadR family transcriptional regulator
LAKQISDAGHRILLLIWTRKNQNGLSFNELRGPPYGLNPKTLARQLKRLHSWGLISRRARKVRGGRQYRYTLTPQGELFLHNPISVDDLDRVLFHALSRVLGYESRIEPQLLGIDLVIRPPDEYQVKLSVNLTWDHDFCNMALQWQKRAGLIQLKARPRIRLRDAAAHPPDPKD